MAKSNKNHWCRIVMNEATQNIMSLLNTVDLDTLEISGRAWSSTKFKTYISVSYPEFDVCNLPNNYNESYDMVIAEQVFEHIRNPFSGTRNVYNILRPGGYFLITTPFFLKVHGAPSDYWRWTANGLRAMLEDCGFAVKLCDSWGNRDCVIGNLDEWKLYNTGMNLANESDFPMLCWALARKPI